MNASKVVEGIAEAMGFWLSQHDVTTPDCLIEGVRQAAERFFDLHSEEIIAALAEKIAARVRLD
jgi:bifunctional pyridoxal-dependent enzyme with beta-cystathionase and maltose regulon repressor activities